LWPNLEKNWLKKELDPVDVEEGRSHGCCIQRSKNKTEPMAKPRTASSPQSESATPTSPSARCRATMEHGAEGVESSRRPTCRITTLLTRFAAYINRRTTSVHQPVRA
jgi:transposase InsO family protein